MSGGIDSCRFPPRVSGHTGANRWPRLERQTLLGWCLPDPHPLAMRHAGGRHTVHGRSAPRVAGEDAQGTRVASRDVRTSCCACCCRALVRAFARSRAASWAVAKAPSTPSAQKRFLALARLWTDTPAKPDW